MSAEVFYQSSAELARVSNTFSVDDVATDPTTVTLVITDPLMVATSYTYAAAEITRTGTGAYYLDVPCVTAGTWQYVWVGTGAASDAVAGTWHVHSTTLQRLYCTPEEFKTRTGIDDALDDSVIMDVLRASSRAIDRHCNRQFFRIESTRTYAAYCYTEVSINDLVSATTIKTDPAGSGIYDTTWTAGTDYQLLTGVDGFNADASAEPLPYTLIEAIGNLSFPRSAGRGKRDLVQVVGIFGWPAVPDAVRQACSIIAADLFKLRQAPFGIAGFGEFGGIRIRDNQRAMSLLSPYVKHKILVG
jgi:hypothetical protein